VVVVVVVVAGAVVAVGREESLVVSPTGDELGVSSLEGTMRRTTTRTTTATTMQKTDRVRVEARSPPHCAGE
jgi:hypothetical protein